MNVLFARGRAQFRKSRAPPTRVSSLPALPMEIRVATPEDVDWMVSQEVREGWNPGVDDAIPFRAADKDGLFVGVLPSGERVACVLGVAFGESYGFIGTYIVVPEHRGKGYGLALFQHALARLGDRCVELEAVEAQQENYAKLGFVKLFNTRRYSFKSPSVPVPRDPHIVPVHLASDLDAVTAFDRECVPGPRSAFLASWLSTRPALQWVEDGRIRGYGVVRPSVSGGVKVAPLFAENADIAQALLDALMGLGAPGTEVVIDIPDVNASFWEGREGWTIGFITGHMATATPPPYALDRVYGWTTLEMG